MQYSSITTGYALLAVGYIAKHKNEPTILSQTISKAYGIPLNYLLRVMQQLVHANILRSKRGPRGGYSFAKPLNKITMLEIIEAIEGPMVGSLDLKELAPREKFSNKADQTYTKALASIRAVLAKAKVSQMI